MSAARRAASAGIALIAVAWALDLPRRAGLLVYPEQILAAVLGLALALRLMPAAEARRPWVDAALALAGLGAAWAVAAAYPRLIRAAILEPAAVLPLTVPLLGCLLVALRRAAGWPLTLVVGAFVLYGVLGHHAPGAFAAIRVEPARLAAQLALDTGGVLGLPLAIAAGVVVVFLVLGQLLERSGGAEAFTQVALALMGGFRGGGAKIAILGSSLFGSISGSAVSNVATTGVVTIPLMRRSGLSAPKAAGIEAVSSTGGQLMPPVMGASAFLMAEFLQVPYREVVLAALVPALLYYLALLVQVDGLAARHGLAAVPREDRPRLGPSLRRAWALPLPFAALVWALFSLNMQPATAALLACAVLVALAATVGLGAGRLGPRGLWSALERAGAAAADVLIVTAAAGVVIGVLNETGLGFNLTLVLADAAGESRAALLVMAAVASIVLGMGMPTVGVYVLLAALVVPSLTAVGVEPLSAHLFVLYLGMMSMITPPVAIAAFAAASLAGAPPMRTAWEAVRLGWSAYAVPFVFVASPALLLTGDRRGGDGRGAGLRAGRGGGVGGPGGSCAGAAGWAPAAGAGRAGRPPPRALAARGRGGGACDHPGAGPGRGARRRLASGVGPERGPAVTGARPAGAGGPQVAGA